MMKSVSYFLLMIFLLAVSACGNRERSKENIVALEMTETDDSPQQKTSIQFTQTEHDFGKVKEGEKVTYSYEFKNTGKTDLLIQSVRASCGCTKPKYDPKPVRPGKTGSIEVIFNTKYRPGKQRKAIRVSTNTEPPVTVLSFTCDVLPTEENNQ